MKTLEQMDAEELIGFVALVPRSRARSLQRLRAVLSVGFFALCGAATYHAVLNAADWRTSDERARTVFMDQRKSETERRDALYVLLRHDAETAAAVKLVAGEAGALGEHARNGLAAGREQWR